ncbi:alpha-amylase [Granulicella sp. WH15]|uniref:alpha-amylase family glycosyl hydrolase n=1 Tax=Granulicella sp. WH15 TaxID=2602070 RepID=UPI001366F88E|nr:alpha-amylase family glycosyl hydrolase [Granulicella sp. WH15]QHN04663.1 alpha-amylase [Granulicella sp. WH15]
MEFHIAREIRRRLNLDGLLFSFTGNVIFANVAASRKLAQDLAELYKNSATDPSSEEPINAGALFAMGLIDELSHALVARYRREKDPAVLAEAIRWFGDQVTQPEIDRLLLTFSEQFPNVAIYRNQLTARQWLQGSTEDISNREAAFEELLLLWLANSNPSFAPFRLLFEDRELKKQTAYVGVTSALPGYFVTRPPVSPGLGSLLDVLRAPMLASPHSLTGQLDFIRENWADYLGEDLNRVLLAIDILREEEVAIWMRFHPAGPDRHRHGAPGFGGEGFVGDEFVGFNELAAGNHRRYAAGYQAPLHEYEAFSADQAWMPTVVLIAKSTYVWLEQLSKKYGRHIHRLDQIPDAELHLLHSRGITGLWLIGLWERSRASRTIKRLRGNPDAVASAYSLKDYAIAEDLGGEAAYADLRDRAARAGLRLASDMVPNHMGVDSDWVIEHPEWFLSRWESPFPVYTFEGPDLSTDSRVEIKIEDHYYDQTDAAVVFRLRHHREGTTRFVYHGNDGTTFAWNDTAQLDYSKAEVREHVIQVILNVARRFPIIRFDAAMVLAKRHVQRLWFPLPGAGGSIPSRAENAISEEAFDALMPHEFWREVVDRVAAEVPGTLLLAEAFWLLEGYFVRTLGMHRVYNSAFMNMLRDEENAKYRSYLKKTVEFDPDILKRYVNFMSNPDERTAIDQFGSGDKYFGVSVLLATLPGLPMFGHGQIEGYTERYGMDFKQARLDESVNDGLVARHESLIAPLLKNRHLFAESTNFVLYDFWNSHGTVDENVFAYSNRSGGQRALIFYNNSYGSTHGTIHMSVGFLEKASGALQQRSLADGLALPDDGASVIAYRDSVSDLEYLRRAGDLRDNGFTLDLRGYQHVVLLGWRELRSSATHPWDRLCDALNGAGVYSLHEALSKLRLGPVIAALSQTISTENVYNFSEMAAEIAALGLRKPKPLEAASVADKLAEKVVEAEPDPRLQEFLLKAHDFAARVAELAHVEGIDVFTTQRQSDQVAALAAASVNLPSLVLPRLAVAIPESLQLAAHLVLPITGTSIPSEPAWGPLLAWIAFQVFPEQPLALFDRLQLRPALAEVFSAIGIEGERAWRAAAQVRVLLRMEDEPSVAAALHSEAFWQDPDLRWLIGSNVSSGTEYFNQEQLEELLCWFITPLLLQIAEDRSTLREGIEQIASLLKEITEAAHTAGYKAKAFIDLITKETPAALEPINELS